LFNHELKFIKNKQFSNLLNSCIKNIIFNNVMEFDKNKN
jgi:hypothetical protein